VVVEGGVSGAVVVGGVSGACDDATPAKQSSMSAELLSRSKRLLRMDMTHSSSPKLRSTTAKNSAAWRSAQPRWREAGAACQFDVRR
jgi:hypothetical protein